MQLGKFVPLNLALKEIWRNKGRFLLISGVIALITLLVIFLAGLGEGLANANREYLSKIDGELLLFQEKSDLVIGASQIGQSTMNDVERIPGIREAAAIGFSSVFIDYTGAAETLGASLLGVEPGKVGEMAVLEGRGLGSERANEAIIDINIARQTGLGVGDEILVLSTQGALDEAYPLTIVGISEGQQLFFAPAVAVPLQTWDRIRPKPIVDNGRSELVFSMIGVQLDNPSQIDEMAQLIEARVSAIEAVDVVTAYESQPGYSEQQTTIGTQRGFTLLIGILVVGGFFQIQTLQKVAQVGVLKALGASNMTVTFAAIIQIVMTNLIGVTLGGLATIALALGLPPGIPIAFVGQQVTVAIVTLLLIGPLGGLVSLRLLLQVEPLTALGLSS